MKVLAIVTICACLALTLASIEIAPSSFPTWVVATILCCIWLEISELHYTLKRAPFAADHLARQTRGESPLPDDVNPKTSPLQVTSPKTRRQPRQIHVYCHSCHREDVHVRAQGRRFKRVVNALPVWLANLTLPYRCVTCGRGRPRHEKTADLIAKLTL